MYGQPYGLCMDSQKQKRQYISGIAVTHSKPISSYYYYYISVFAKMRFFKISVILCFSVGLLLYIFFFSGQLFSAVSRPIRTKFCTNTSSCMRFILRRAILEMFKNQVTRAKKHRKIGHFSDPAVTFLLVVTKRLKFFCKIFSAMTPRVLYLSENVIVTVQNRPVFSITRLNGASKKTDFDGKYLENGKSYGQS